jgi:hypothetical protein
LGSFDRHVRPDEPDRPDRRDAAADQPGPSHETDAQLAERLGLSGLTRAAAYESLYAKAHAQDAPFRERLAREEREESAERRESLSEPADSPSPQNPPDPPIDRPERDLEATRNYWTEVPRFLVTWQFHADTWRRFLTHKAEDQPKRSDARDRSSEADSGADIVIALEQIPRAEPRISENFTTTVDDCSRHAWAGGFDFRLKGPARIKEKVIEKLAAQPDRPPDEIVRQIPDAIRYTCCFETKDYPEGIADIKQGLERCGYEMYYSENYWSNPEYKGINTRWVTAEGQRFEVQFHTAESFNAKHVVTHKAYERLRDPATSDRERLELQAFQRDVSSWIPVPPGSANIPNYKNKKEGY